MRILYFTHFYSPENIAAAFRATEHSKAWVGKGHDVTVFTGWPNYPTGKVFEGYEMKRLSEEVDEGVRVFRSKSIICSNASFVKRAISGLSFLAYGLVNLRSKKIRSRRYDLVLATSGTPFAAVLGCVYAKSKRLPFVIEFRDLTYRAMAATSASGEDRKAKLMKSIELSLCKQAKSVVVLTTGFAKVLQDEGMAAEKLFVVPNGADLVACSHQWEKPIRFGYFGTMGISQDVPRTIEYFKALADDGLAAQYILVGEGADRKRVVEEIEASGDYPIALEHGVSQQELERYYGCVDMTVVSLRASDEFSDVIPSKIFQSLARGVPVLFVGPDGEAAQIIRESGAGVVLCGDDDENLGVLSDFVSQEHLEAVLDEMSNNAVAFMEEHYTRKRMADQMLDVLRFAAKEENKDAGKKELSNG